MIQTYIEELVNYGIEKNLIEESDRVYITNSYLQLFKLDSFTPIEKELPNRVLCEILDDMLDYAYANQLMEDNTITYRDLFDTKIMGIMMPRPSEVIKKFRADYKESSLKATDNYYALSCNSNYIRKDRIAKDRKWVTNTEYGPIDITINLSKPEKDPKDIARAGKAKQSGYPKCMLCKENEGFEGTMTHPARQNHRIIPITINDTPWFFQYSPYVYYNEHCIVFNSSHTPMAINHEAFCKLFDFVKQFPHYFVGSNADLPIVGGSILSHDHFQGGHYEFAMAKAEIEKKLNFDGFEDIEAGIVKWPMSVIRIKGKDTKRLIELADKILDAWRGYSDEESFIYAYTEDTPHNTITPIARMRGEDYEMDLVLRNNITTEDCPWGVYHPAAKYHHIKKENIGLIEVMGLAVLPARLKKEMEHLQQAILAGENLHQSEDLEKHAYWVDEWKSNYPSLNKENIEEVVQEEIGKVFLKVLECAGVYKRDEAGQAAFVKFADYVNNK